MEFYEQRCLICFVKSMVSIPNGMEFYSTLNSRTMPRQRFQFPTGWNSTVQINLSEIIKIVSIPNGMEFYYGE